MTILIADSGSTKTNWILLENGIQVLNFKGLGINPYVNSIKDIQEILNEIAKEITTIKIIDLICFYGAGCSNEDSISKINDAFNSSWLKSKRLEVNHDLMAAARALFGNKEGIACILGTGSNSALYNGNSIIDNIPSLGYVIGDEGGGMDIGRRLIISVFKRTAPQELIDKFYHQFDLDVRELLNNIHFKERPNKFIASFSLFVNENIHHVFCKDLVHSAFESFIKLNIRQYPNYQSIPISFIGSVAISYEKILKEVLIENELICGDLIKDPMEGLIEYHLGLLS